MCMHSNEGSRRGTRGRTQSFEPLPRVLFVLLHPRLPGPPAARHQRTHDNGHRGARTRRARGSPSARAAGATASGRGRRCPPAVIPISSCPNSQDSRARQRPTLSARRLSLRSSPSCTSISPVGTLCRPSRCPANPAASFSCARASRSACSFARAARARSADVRSDLAVMTDASMRRFAAFCSSARFWVAQAPVSRLCRERQAGRRYLREHACGLVALLLCLPRRHAAGRRRVRVLGGLGVLVHVLAVADGHPGGHSRHQWWRGGVVHFGLDARVRVRLREALRLGVVRGA
jgi:hypothetical protein